jgi:four helix bundle protein
MAHNGKENVVRPKSFELAVQIVQLLLKKGNSAIIIPMTKQLMRCGASVGANVFKADSVQSHAEFIHKMSKAH